MQTSIIIGSIISTLLASTVAAEDPSTTSSFSYSIPIDLSVISSELATVTDSRLIQLVSEFEQAKGTSALISLASVYGSDFLKGTLTDIASLAQDVATVSGAADASNSVITASSVQTIATSSAAAVTTASNLTLESSITSTISGTISGSIGLGSNSVANNLTQTSNDTSSSSAAGSKNAAFFGLPIVIGGGLLALL